MEASFTIVMLLLGAAATVFWVWAVIDVLRRPGPGYRRGTQVVWAVVIALTHSLGALAYVAFGRPRPASAGAGR